MGEGRHYLDEPADEVDAYVPEGVQLAQVLGTGILRADEVTVAGGHRTIALDILCVIPHTISLGGGSIGTTYRRGLSRSRRFL